MNREETKKILAILEEAYPNTRFEDKRLALQLWEAEFAAIPFQTMISTIRFHMKKDDYFPTFAKLNKIIYTKAYLAMETSAAIEQKAIEGERIIKWEDCGCQLCPFLKEGQTEPCEVCVF